MNLDFLSPVAPKVLNQLETLHPSCLGHQIAAHTAAGLPDLSDVQIALFGVRENRRETTPLRENFDFDQIRSSLYALFPGNWHTKIADLGDIKPGKDLSDTEYAVHQTMLELLEQNIIPIIMGGSQDLTYAQYRAYDYREEMVNLVNVDARFDIGNTETAMTDRSYIGHIITQQPYKLFNYANIGYQSYLNPPDEIALIEELFFEAYRLGDIAANLTLAEPVMRDADMVSMDLNAVHSAVSGSLKKQPNGFGGREICALARYAGISDKVSSFGLYNLQNLNFKENYLLLASEILWYFIEGINFRKNEPQLPSQNNFIKYNVPIDHETLSFYKSKRSERWWIEIPMLVNNKLKRKTFLPCSYQDYLEACDQEIPERWYKARRKNEL